MNVGQIKTKIFLLSLLDWILYVLMVGIGVYAVMYSENPILFGLTAIAGLLIISKIGDNLRGRIAQHRVELEKHQKKMKKNLGNMN